MTKVKSLMVTCAAGLAVAGVLVGSAGARAQDVMGREASECDIAASLNVEKPGCPPVKRHRTRGLAIGNIDAMPPQAPPSVTPTPVVAPRAPEAPTPPRVTRAEPAATRPAPAAAAAPRHEYKAAFQINFEFGSTQITQESREILDRVGSVLNSEDAANVRFRIVGHTDGVGSANNNQSLSERRAASVRQYLEATHGVPGWRLESEGKGESELLNRANPNAAENRRVEIINLGS